MCNERLAAFTSRAASAEQSIPQLLARRNALRAEQQSAAGVADAYRAQDRELHELEPERAAMGERVEEANRVIEALTMAKSSLAWPWMPNATSLRGISPRLAKSEEVGSQQLRTSRAFLRAPPRTSDGLRRAGLA